MPNTSHTDVSVCTCTEDPSNCHKRGACMTCDKRLQHDCQTSMSPPSSSMSRESYILILTVFYATTAIGAWVFTCVLSVHPITTDYYGISIGNGSPYPFSSRDNLDHDIKETYQKMRSLYSRNEQWYRAARVLQSLVSVLTLPLTTAVCSSAAVIFMQRRQSHGHLSLRQTMALADKAWANILTCAKIFPFFATKTWKKYGSSLLQLAIFLNVLGVIISPLQQVFLSTKTVKTPTAPEEYDYLVDIPNQFEPAEDSGLRDDTMANNTIDNNKVVVITRAALASATTADPQSQLWYDFRHACIFEDPGYTDGTCNPLAVTFGHFNPFTDPDDAFFAQIPVGFNSGLIRQFMPRINSSAQFDQITSSEFSNGCEQTQNSFFVDYASDPDLQNVATHGWAIQACMPGDLTKAPWKSTRTRQDFSEELFLNMTLKSSEAWNNTFYRITLKTTAGYFELPNYMNGVVAGPILDRDPNELCGKDCMTQRSNYVEGPPTISHHDLRRNEWRSARRTDDPSQPLETVMNKGPLLTITLALFGEGSFLQQNSFNYTSPGPGQTHDDRNVSAQYCTNLLPLQFILGSKGWYSLPDENSAAGACVQGGGNDSMAIQIVEWLKAFHLDDFGEYSPDVSARMVESSFQVAAFIANKAWMESQRGSLSVNFDLGADSPVPSISRAGVIVISFLLGLDLLLLIPLAAYAAWNPRWTSQLDSFAMMRVGATLGDKVPLLMRTEKADVKILDELPGWIGDDSQEEYPAGMLALGGSRPLTSRKNGHFECYEEDATPVMLKVRQAVGGVFYRLCCWR